MRALVIIGILVLVLGVVVLGFQGVTYFTQERVVDAGPVKVDVQRPHTVIFNPIAGVAAVGAGLVLVLIGIGSRRPA